MQTSWVSAVMVIWWTQIYSLITSWNGLIMQFHAWLPDAISHASQHVNKFYDTFWSSEMLQYIADILTWKAFRALIFCLLTAHHATIFSLLSLFLKNKRRLTCCVSVYPPPPHIVAGQWLVKDFPIAVNTCRNRRIVGHIVFCEVCIISKENLCV
jgi:hypothetical protein